MKRLHWVSLIILVISVSTFIYFNNLIEGYRGGHGGGHGGRHGSRHGGGYYYGRGNNNYMTRPLHYYGNQGYTWHNPWYLSRGNVCKNGCTNLGNGNWGCHNPGYGSHDCWFSSDCDEC
jgi:hypothetical protein